MTSELTDALNRILLWLERNNQQWFLEYLRSGLSRSEIDNCIKDLPIQLPPEVYQLYQWRNGTIEGDFIRETDWIFNHLIFNKLNDAVAQYQKFNRFHQRNQIPPDLPIPHDIPGSFEYDAFPIFYNGSQGDIGYIWINPHLEFCPVIFENTDSGDHSLIQKYTSLTTMMMTIAERYETGAYYQNSPYFQNLDPDDDCRQKIHQIWRKYNSQVVEVDLYILHKNLQNNTHALDEVLHYVSKDLIEFKESISVRPLMQIVQAPIQDNIDIYSIYSQIKPKQQAVSILGQLGDPRAVTAIIDFFNNDYYPQVYCLSRVYAAKALGQLKDKGATLTLIDALRDKQNEVRETAAWALGEIGDKRAVEPLTKLMQDPDSKVRQAAIDALDLILPF